MLSASIKIKYSAKVVEFRSQNPLNVNLIYQKCYWDAYRLRDRSIAL